MTRPLQVLLVGLVLAGCATHQPSAGGPQGPEAPAPATLRVPAGPGGPGTLKALVRAAMGPSGCIVTKPSPGRVNAGGQVFWTFENGCDSPHTLTVANFNPDWPFVDTPPTASCTAGSTKQCQIHLSIRQKDPKFHGPTTYEYDILLDGQKVDPEIIIDWPMT